MIVDVNTVFGFIPKNNFDASLDRLLILMKEHKIQRACSLSLKGLYYDFKEGNDETWLSSLQNEAIIPVATIDPRKYVGCWDEIGRRIDQGFKIFRLFPTEQGWHHDYAPFERFLKITGEYKVPVLIPAALGMTPVAKMVSRFGVPVIFTGVSYGGLGEALVLMEDMKDIYIETSRLNTPDAYELIVDTVGAERVIFGSGAPLEHIGSVLEPILVATITQEERDMIFKKNIMRLLGLN